MKHFLLFLLITLSLYSDVIKEITIADKPYVIVHESYNEYSDKGIEMKLYTQKQNRDTLPLLSFTLENQSGGCAEKSIQHGTYTIEGDKIILYSHWARSGRAYDAPSGDRKQVYSLDKDGNLTRVSGQVYIEKTKRGKEMDEGMKYLYTPATTEKEKKALTAYIRSVEHIFEADFVRGEQANTLAHEVEQALREKSKQRWQ